MQERVAPRDDPAERRWFGHRTISKLLLLDVALALVFLAVVAPWVQELTAQGAARYTLTAAIHEQRTFDLTEYEDLVGVDRVEIDGRVFSDKAPGQPIAGVPVLAIADLLGAPPARAAGTTENLGLWSQTLVFCAVPGAALLVLMRRHASRTLSIRTSVLAAASLAFGTMLLPFSSNLWGHVFVTALSFGAWHLVSEEAPSSRQILVAGSLAAYATLSEYQMIAIAVGIGAWVATEIRWRQGLLFLSPQVVAVALIVVHNRLVYDSLSTGYTAKSDEGQLNFVGVPKPSHVVDIFIGEKGLIFQPVIIVAIATMVLLAVRRDAAMTIPAYVVAVLLILQAGWVNPWGGEGPGPRYLTAAIPFLVVAAGRALASLRAPTRAVLVGVGVVSMSLVLATFDLIPTGQALVTTQIRYLSDRGVTPTIFTIALGDAGWVLHAGLVAASLLLLAHALRLNPGASSLRGDGLQASSENS